MKRSIRFVGLVALSPWLCCLPGCLRGDAPTAAQKPATNPAGAPFENDILAFEAADKKAMPAKGGIVFYGSSSFTRWQTLAKDFPDLPVINRGFGGSTTPDAVRFVDRVVIPYEPRTVVLYEGDNDLAKGNSPEQVLADTQSLVKRLREKLPQAKIIVLSVKSSPSRMKIVDKQKATNVLLEKWIKEAGDSNLIYVDVFTPQLDEKGQPRAELFAADKLHLNAEGYKNWIAILTPMLK